MRGFDRIIVLDGSRLVGLAALAAIPPQLVMPARQEGKTEALKQLGYLPFESNRKEARQYKRSQRGKKEYRLKGVRP